MASSPQPDPLPDRLAEWRVAPQRNPQFRTAVWARIDTARRSSNWARFARAHPTMVSAVLLGAILAGAWTGRTEARERTDAVRESIAANYVHALDARWMRRP